MSPDGFVRVDQVWKRFRADRNRQLLRDELSRVRRQLSGEAVQRWRWAVRDVSFEVQPGSSLALIGSNGSGKSTMLKILAGIMYPTYGAFEAHGRIGALIEVRAGIHPDLSGRENVFMFGSLLGLKRSDIRERFDDIVAFAELGDAIDRQVKYYSSGMGMRLGFAVAAFLEPDIMVVDEVLAVGDASFQQRCLDRMREVMAQGTTLLYVSHDLATVEAMCQQALWIDQGVTCAQGPTREVIAQYRRSLEVRAVAQHQQNAEVEVVVNRVVGEGGGRVMANSVAELGLTVISSSTRPVQIALGFSQGSPAPIFLLQQEAHLPKGTSELICRVEHLPLPAGHYAVYATVLDERGDTIRAWSPIGQFEVDGLRLEPPPTGVVRLSPISVEAAWEQPKPDDHR